jgi:hypothetical protein
LDAGGRKFDLSVVDDIDKEVDAGRQINRGHPHQGRPNAAIGLNLANVEQQDQFRGHDLRHTGHGIDAFRQGEAIAIYDMKLFEPPESFVGISRSGPAGCEPQLIGYTIRQTMSGS